MDHFTGTSAHNSTYPCQRCHVTGQPINGDPKNMCYPEVNNARRSKDRWAFYSSVEESGVRVPKPHRRYRSPFFDNDYDCVSSITSSCRVILVGCAMTVRSNILQTTLFVVDMMHTVDGGALSLAIQYLLSIGFDAKSKWKRFLRRPSEGFFSRADQYWKVWKKCLPKDFARQPRTLSEFSLWKMRETHNAGVFFIPALRNVEGLGSELDEAAFDNYMKLIGAIRILCTFSTQALAQVGTRQVVWEVLCLNVSLCRICRPTYKSLGGCWRTMFVFIPTLGRSMPCRSSLTSSFTSPTTSSFTSVVPVRFPHTHLKTTWPCFER